jgi:hypothetical protein
MKDTFEINHFRAGVYCIGTTTACLAKQSKHLKSSSVGQTADSLDLVQSVERVH